MTTAENPSLAKDNSTHGLGTELEPLLALMRINAQMFEGTISVLGKQNMELHRQLSELTAANAKLCELAVANEKLSQIAALSLSQIAKLERE
jgi:hypothetical protein